MQVKILQTRERACVQLIPSGKCAAPINISWSDFWELCREGERINTRSEVCDFLNDAPDEMFTCANMHITAEEIIRNDDLMNDIVEQVIADRHYDESTDQIYNAMMHILKHHISKEA